MTRAGSTPVTGNLNPCTATEKYPEVGESTVVALMEINLNLLAHGSHRAVNCATSVVNHTPCEEVLQNPGRVRSKTSLALRGTLYCMAM